MAEDNDARFMAAAIRLARRNEGRTGTNPSVACMLVRHEPDGARIVGSGVTALGGRPHAEPLAIAEAGELARGATAYVTLEPCAHHGRTPPCAQTLIDAGVTRVVTAVVDPDPRVDEKGHAMLRAAGLEVSAGLLADQARTGLAAYLTHKRLARAHVTLKLAVSSDGHLGRRGEAQAPITGAEARAQSHLLRARHQAILVGAGTLAADDPELTCRLPGLEERSPIRIVLDAAGRLTPDAKLLRTAHRHKVWIVAPPGLEAHKPALDAGCEILPCELVGGRIALPELLDDLGARGVMSLLIEGGAAVAKSFMDEGLVDRLALFEGASAIGDSGAVASPLLPQLAPPGFVAAGRWQFGEDTLYAYERAG